MVFAMIKAERDRKPPASRKNWYKPTETITGPPARPLFRFQTEPLKPKKDGDVYAFLNRRCPEYRPFCSRWERGPAKEGMNISYEDKQKSLRAEALDADEKGAASCICFC